MNKTIFYIKKKNLQRFTFDDLLALFKEHDGIACGSAEQGHRVFDQKSPVSSTDSVKWNT